MIPEKIKYSKCPHCQKYGIKAGRGVGQRSNYLETCKYCKKSFRVNWAFSFFAKIGLVFFIFFIYYLTDCLKLPFNEWIAIIAVLIISYATVRFYPMEEETPQYVCQCCTLKTLFLNPKFYSKKCSVCSWISDPEIKDDRTIVSLQNNICLDEAKQNFTNTGTAVPPKD